VDLKLFEAAESYDNDLQKWQGIDIQWKEGSPDKP